MKANKFFQFKPWHAVELMYLLVIDKGYAMSEWYTSLLDGYLKFYVKKTHDHFVFIVVGN